LVYQVVEVIRKGGVIIYPTDLGYALGCRVGEKQALDSIKRFTGCISINSAIIFFQFIYSLELLFLQ
jgi:tRNA A37 threonylcarbamoyladenosine synthetase subunit TsaC/SUA5/YrdC